MPVLAQSGVCGPCAPGPSQGGTPGTVWNDGNDGFSNATLGVTVTAGGGSSSVDYISTVAGWIGLAAGAGDPSSGGLSVGTNLRIYSAPRGNQYFTTLTKLSTVFKVYGAGAIIVGGVADYYNGSQTGSYFQANLNLSIGVTGFLLPPLAIPGAFYFAASTNYPGGGPEAYNQAFSDDINAAECCGP